MHVRLRLVLRYSMPWICLLERREIVKVLPSTLNLKPIMSSHPHVAFHRQSVQPFTTRRLRLAHLHIFQRGYSRIVTDRPLFQLRIWFLRPPHRSIITSHFNHLRRYLYSTIRRQMKCPPWSGSEGTRILEPSREDRKSNFFKERDFGPKRATKERTRRLSTLDPELGPKRIRRCLGRIRSAGPHRNVLGERGGPHVTCVASQRQATT